MTYNSISWPDGEEWFVRVGRQLIAPRACLGRVRLPVPGHPGHLGYPFEPICPCDGPLGAPGSQLLLALPTAAGLIGVSLGVFD